MMCPISEGSSDLIPEYEALRELTPHAKTAASHAYSPYSGLKVGAAIKVRNGDIYTGCNMENSSYGLTQCAERNAIGSAIANGVKKGDIRFLVIYVPGDTPFAPCGGCRQVMHEMMSYDAQVISCCEGDDSDFWQIKELLPDPFDL
jgi:cytidine deaminase